MEAVFRLSGTIQSLNANVDYLSPNVEVLQNGHNDVELIREGAQT